MASFRYVHQVAAPPETVFDVLTDHRRYTEITPLRKAELEREGEPAPNGLGAIRVLSAVPGPPMREEVIGYERPNRFSYKILSGLPVRDHVGTVELKPAGGGTELTYAVKTTPTIPLSGPVFMAILKKAIRDLIAGVAKESERRAADAR
jgi:carbon monoxide dehydrogenase subunit G